MKIQLKIISLAAVLFVAQPLVIGAHVNSPGMPDVVYERLTKKRAELKELTAASEKKISSLEENIKAQTLAREALQGALKAFTREMEERGELKNGNTREDVVAVEAVLAQLGEILDVAEAHLKEAFPPQATGGLLKKIAALQAELNNKNEPPSVLMQKVKAITDRVFALDGSVSYREASISPGSDVRLRGYIVSLGAAAHYFISSDYSSAYIWIAGNKKWKKRDEITGALENAVKILKKQKPARIILLPVSKGK